MSDPVLTSSWCTAWGSYNTPRLWAMVKDEDDPDAWRQVAAWGDISGAMKDQRALLLQAREALVAAWPPEQNKSSAAFVGEVDKLIARMDAAKTEADDTATGLANILEALRQAKNNIQPLWEQYKDKSDDLVPAWWDNAEDELDKQAQAHMLTAEQIVQDNVARLRVPDPYALEPTDPHYQPTPLSDGNGPGGGSSGGLGSAGGRGATGVAVPVPHDPVPPLPGHEPTVPDGPSGTGPGSVGSVVGSGPGLAGVINPTGVTPAPVPPPGGGPPPPGGGGPGIVPPPGPIVGPGIGGVGPVGTGGSGGAPIGRRGTGPGAPGLSGGGIGGTGGGGVSGLGAGGVGGLGRGARPEAAGRRALPSGAVIGETVAGAGRGGAGTGGAGVGGPGVGGVGGAAGRGAGARGAGQGRGSEQGRPPRPAWLPDEPVGAARTAGQPGPGGPGRGGRRDEREQRPFDPDNPWEVAQGVRPVIAPGAEHTRHDPGPNVIGWHG
jgi:hypothetical protein